MADCNAAYAAGLFDGEGCVALYMRSSGSSYGRRDHSLRAHLNVSNVDLRPLNWLKDGWGGTVRIWTPKPGYRAQAVWRIFSGQADIFAADIRPFLQVKGEQLDLWMQARAMMHRRGYMPGGITPDELTIRRELVARVKELKQVG